MWWRRMTLAYPEHFGEDRLHARSGLLDAFLDSLSSGSRRKWTEAASSYDWPSVAQRAWNTLNRAWGGPDGMERDAVHKRQSGLPINPSGLKCRFRQVEFGMSGGFLSSS